jgi:hypothetical protein
MIRDMEPLVTQLTRLHELHLLGGLSEQEFAQAKALVLKQANAAKNCVQTMPHKQPALSPASVLLPAPASTHTKQATLAFMAAGITLVALFAQLLASPFSSENIFITMTLIGFCSFFFMVGMQHLNQLNAEKNARFEELRRELATRAGTLRTGPALPVKSLRVTRS